MGSNILSLTGADAASRFLGFFAVAYLARTVGPEGMGLLAAGMGILTWGTILAEAGLPTLGTRTVATSNAASMNLVHRFFTTRLVLSLGVLILFAPILFFTLDTLRLRNITLIYLLALLPSALVLEWVFQGLRKMTILATGRIVAAVSYLFWVLMFVRSESSIIWIPVGWVASVVAQSIYLWKQYGGVNETESTDVPPALNLIKTAFPLAVAGLVAQVITHFPVVYLGITDPHEGGLFSVAYRIIVLLLVVDRVFYTIFFPSITRHLKIGGEDLFTRFNRTLKLVTPVTLYIAIIAIMGSRQILPAVFGSEFNQSALIFQILALYFVCSVINSVFTFTLIGAKKEKTYLNSILLGGAGFFGIMLLPGPVPSSHFAAMGLVLFQVISLLVMMREVQTFISFSVARSLLLPIVASGVLMGVFSLTYPLSPLLTFLASLVITPVVLYKSVGITSEEKLYYIKSIS